MGQYWLYRKDGKECGPVKEEEIVELIRKGVLSPETIMKSISMFKWEMAGKLDEFRSKFRMSSLTAFAKNAEAPVIPSDQDVPETEKKPFTAIIHEEPEINPLHRFFARYLDYTVFYVLLGLPIAFAEEYGLIPESSIENLEFIIYFAVYFVWIFIEALLLSTWGYTPAKYAFDIIVRTNAGEKLSFQQALYRSFIVWFWGMGAGLPLFATIANIVGAIKLSRNGITKWDLAGGFEVSHPKWGIVRKIIVVVIILAMVSLALISVYLEQKRELTGDL